MSLQNLLEYKIVTYYNKPLILNTLISLGFLCYFLSPLRLMKESSGRNSFYRVRPLSFIRVIKSATINLAFLGTSPKWGLLC